MNGKAPLRTRIVRDARDWEAMTGDQVIAGREKGAHSFLSTPGLVPAARPARSAILAFLRSQLCPTLRG
jgi:acetyl esterase